MNKSIIVDRLDNNISFTIQEGEFVALIGTRDSKKDEIFETISGIKKTDIGFVSILGYDPNNKKESLLKQISVLSNKKNRLWLELTLSKILKIYKDIYVLKNKEFNKNFEELVKLFDVSKYTETPLKLLPKDVLAKMEVVLALIHKPEVLLINDPKIDLNYIYEYNRLYKTTVLAFCNDINQFTSLVRRTIAIDKNGLVYDGALEEMIYKYAPNMLIKLVLKDDLNIDQLDKIGKIKKNNIPEIHFLIPRNEIPEKIIEITQTLSIQKIEVEEISIEEIVKNIIYK